MQFLTILMENRKFHTVFTPFSRKNKRIFIFNSRLVQLVKVSSLCLARVVLFLVYLIIISYNVALIGLDHLDHNIIFFAIPAKIYPNADIQKLDMLKENRGRAGIYRWINKINEKTYVGSSIDLSCRLKNYFNISYLESGSKKSNSMIYKALLKNGYSNFTLEILEYCDLADLICREQYYLDLLKPEYNILKWALSLLGLSIVKKVELKYLIL